LVMFPKSNEEQIELELFKDIETWGKNYVQPNRWQYLAADSFNFLNIEPPESMITSAQTRLDNAMKAYLLDNNTDKYEYPLVIDEYFLQQNEDFIKHFSYRLKKVSNEINDGVVKSNLNSLIFELQNSKFPYERNNELYKDISTTFLYNLEKKYPTLTEEERKLCVLIFLNYKNKEIATSLNLSLRSIENHRYRIRKKISIETDISLYQYFQGLQ